MPSFLFNLFCQQSRQTVLATALLFRYETVFMLVDYKATKTEGGANTSHQNISWQMLL
jgi:hypothetical protein